MPEKAHRFCVLTVGRAGSTSLMNALERFPDIAVPRTNIPELGNELIHPRHLQTRLRRYAEFSGTPIANAEQLMECFFRLNAGKSYAGFKSMPNRHDDLDAFLARRDIRFITLIRRDIASTVASFLVAAKSNLYSRAGEPHSRTWRFVAAQDGKQVLANLAYVRRSLARLSLVPNAIALAYENLCDPAYRNAALDDFFGRPIRIENPRPPTSGGSYIENWDEFRAFIDQGSEKLVEDARAAAARPRPAADR